MNGQCYSNGAYNNYCDSEGSIPTVASSCNQSFDDYYDSDDNETSVDDHFHDAARYRALKLRPLRPPNATYSGGTSRQRGSIANTSFPSTMATSTPRKICRSQSTSCDLRGFIEVGRDHNRPASVSKATGTRRKLYTPKRHFAPDGAQSTLCLTELRELDYVSGVHYLADINNYPRRSVYNRRNNLRTAHNVDAYYDTTEPLISRRVPLQKSTAIILPTLKRESTPTENVHSHFQIPKPVRKISPIKTFQSPSKLSWFGVPSQSFPLWTLRTAAIFLLISGTAGCFLSFHLMARKGKSFEMIFSSIASFVALCLGFPCPRFHEWQWQPNRNYVTGYILVSLFSVIEMAALWVLDQYAIPSEEIVDVIRGALCAISTLLICFAIFGVVASSCCKYPPPDNRVAHGVQGISV